MTRDDIEMWLEANVPEAIERLPDSSRSVKQWVNSLAKTLVFMAKEEAEEAEAEDAEDGDPIEDDDDLDDEEVEDEDDE